MRKRIVRDACGITSAQFSLRPFWISLAITPAALLTAAVSSGFGHGTYVAAKGLYPYLMLLLMFSETARNVPSLWLLAVIQFPAYGLALSVARHRKAEGKWVCAIGVLHVVAATIAWACSSNYGR